MPVDLETILILVPEGALILSATALFVLGAADRRRAAAALGRRRGSARAAAEGGAVRLQQPAAEPPDGDRADGLDGAEGQQQGGGAHQHDVLIKRIEEEIRVPLHCHQERRLHRDKHQDVSSGAKAR